MPKQKDDIHKHAPPAFLRDNYQIGSRLILGQFRRLPARSRLQLERFALTVLHKERLRKDRVLRDGAIRLIVALLPYSFAYLEDILEDKTSFEWYEVHFTAFSALDRSDLRKIDQDRVLKIMKKYLLDSTSTAGYAAWKAGDMLGDEWHSHDAMRILRDALLSAPFAAGRNGALHGIQHYLQVATSSERKELRSAVRKLVNSDRSQAVRRRAQETLKGGGCAKRPRMRASLRRRLGL